MDSHPIQLEHVGISTIDFTGYRSGSPAETVSESMVDVKFSYSPYEEGRKTIMIMGEATVGAKLENPDMEEIERNPFYLHIKLHGFFSVNEEEFPIEYADRFASKNAPTLMYPFVREHVHSLAIRCGYPSVMLPLIRIPPKEEVGRDLEHE